eukprot:jgi/Botrbrau1/17685/Bobra.0166s0109.1
MSTLPELTEENAALKKELFRVRRVEQDLHKALAQFKEENVLLQGRVHDLLIGSAADTSLERQLEELRGELERERAARQQAEQSLEACEKERKRLQRARDELAAQVLVGQDLEDELKQAQEYAEALSRELQTLRATSGTLGDPAPVPESVDISLKMELEAERKRAEALSVALAAVRAEKASVDGELAAVRDRLRELPPHLQAPGPASEGFAASSGGVSAQTSDLPRGLELDGKAQDAGPPSVAASQEGSQVGPSAASAADAVDALTRQVGQLRASRDRLLLQVDAQSGELERFSHENSSLVQGLQEAREVGVWWEGQVQSALAQIELLKDMLEESARWDVGPQAPGKLPTSPPHLPPPSPPPGAGARGGLRVRTAAARMGSPMQRRSPNSPALVGTPPMAASPFASYAQTPFQDDVPPVPPDAPRDGNGPGTAAAVPHAGNESLPVAGQPQPGRGTRSPTHMTPPVPASPQAKVPEARAPRGGHAPRHPDPAWSAPTSGTHETVAAAYEALQHKLLAERARSATLDLQVRALCAELVRVADVTGNLGRAMLPALSGVAGRLTQLATVQASKPTELALG